jgi:hypothetical protein
MAFEDLNDINAGDKITATWLNRLVLKVNEQERRIASLERELETPRIVESAPVELDDLETAGTPAVYNARLIVQGVPNIEDADPDIDSLGTVPDETNAIVWNVAAFNGGAVGRYLGMRAGGVPVLAVNMPFIAVTLAGTGADGDETGPPEYLYDARDNNGNLIGEDMEPAHNRPIGATMIGTFGIIAFFDGLPVLIWTDEKPNFAEC